MWELLGQKKRAQILYAANRRVYGKWQSAYPSRFIEELPEEHIVHDINPGLPNSQNNLKQSRQINFFTPEKATHSRRRQFGQDLEFNGTSWELSSNQASSEYVLGERVFHQKFGYGAITDIDGNKLEIEFEKAGNKKVLDSFIQRHHSNRD